MERTEVYKLIDGERDYQDSRWNEFTTASKGKHSPEEWFYYIQRYLNLANEVLSTKSVQEAYPEAMAIMRKVGAMAVCAMEQHETPAR